MKFFTIILAATFLFLALKPGIDLIPLPDFSGKGGCCSTQCSQSDESVGNFPNSMPKGCCGEDGCNPFRICCSIMLFYLEIPYDQAQKQFIACKRNFTYRSIQNLLFISDFWQPPKFV